MAEENNPTLQQVITANEQPTESTPVTEAKLEQTELKVEEKPKEEGTNKLECSQENKDLSKYIFFKLIIYIVTKKIE